MCYKYNKGPIFSRFQSLYGPELWKGDARDKRMAVRRRQLLLTLRAYSPLFTNALSRAICKCKLLLQTFTNTLHLFIKEHFQM